jgi:hypothetical protein
MSEPGKQDRQTRRGDLSREQHPEHVGVRMPQLFVIPAGTKPARCGCGMWHYFVAVDGTTRSISISGAFHSKKAGREIAVPGCKPPTATSPGLGFDHHIDCVQREQYRRRGGSTARRTAETPDERAGKVRAAEELARRFGIRCTGAPRVTDCNGDAVVVFLLAKRLFATPCSVHADATQRAITDAARSRAGDRRAIRVTLDARTRMAHVAGRTHRSGIGPSLTDHSLKPQTDT